MSRRPPSAEALRRAFRLDPRVAYLNHGGFGAVPRPVFARFQTWQARVERNPTAFFQRELPDLLAQARARLGHYLGASADDVVYVQNATVGLNTVARSMPLAPDDEVLATDQEYGAVERAWRFVCEQRGARYVARPLPRPLDDPAEVVKALVAGVTPRTRVLALSHVTSATGAVLPLADIASAARERDLITVVDGAHAIGQVPVDLEALGVDVYVGNMHKWLCAPRGSAVLYARRAIQPLLQPLVVSWGWRPDSPGASAFVDMHEWQGTRDVSAFLATPDAIDFLAAHDWDAVRARCHGQLARFHAALGEVTGLTPLAAIERHAQMAALPLPSCDTARVARRLLAEHAIEVQVYRWREQPVVRVSVQGYNTDEELARLLDALPPLVRQEAA